MWAIFRAAGWAGLSVATSLGWVAAFLLIVRWAGTFRAGRALSRAVDAGAVGAAAPDDAAARTCSR